jgi:pantothenate synthetase
VGLSAALAEAVRLWTAAAPAGDIERTMRTTMERHAIAVDYAAIVEAESLETARDGVEAVALVAGRLGATRLIDNHLLPARGRGAAPC